MACVPARVVITVNSASSFCVSWAAKCSALAESALPSVYTSSFIGLPSVLSFIGFGIAFLLRLGQSAFAGADPAAEDFPVARFQVRALPEDGGLARGADDRAKRFAHGLTNHRAGAAADVGVPDVF